MKIYSNPLLEIYLNKDKKGFKDSIETQGTETHKGMFDGIKYSFDHSHTLGSFYFTGKIDKNYFVIHAPENRELKLFLGAELEAAVIKSRESNKESEFIAACYQDPDNVKNLFNEMFVNAKINNVVENLEKSSLDKGNKTTFLREVNKLLFANACIRIWANRKVSELDLEIIKNFGIEITDISTAGGVLTVKFGEVEIVMFKNSPIYIETKIQENGKVIYKNSIKVGVVFPITPENKILQEEFYKALNFYFEHCER